MGWVGMDMEKGLCVVDVSCVLMVEALECLAGLFAGSG